MYIVFLSVFACLSVGIYIYIGSWDAAPWLRMYVGSRGTAPPWLCRVMCYICEQWLGMPPTCRSACHSAYHRACHSACHRACHKCMSQHIPLCMSQSMSQVHVTAHSTVHVTAHVPVGKSQSPVHSVGTSRMVLVSYWLERLHVISLLVVCSEPWSCWLAEKMA